jgi:DNA-binding transcriptional MerR regulator
MPEKDLYSMEDVCYTLSANEKQVRYWIRKGYLVPFSNSRRYRFTRKAIEHLLELGEKMDIYGGENEKG